MRIPITIANGASLSPAVDTGNIGNAKLIGIEMSAAWTAAGLTFQVSPDGTNYFNLQTDAAEATAVAAAAQVIGLRGDLSSVLSKYRYLKVRSGTSGTPVNQGADRALFLLFTKD